MIKISNINMSIEEQVIVSLDGSHPAEDLLPLRERRSRSSGDPRDIQHLIPEAYLKQIDDARKKIEAETGLKWEFTLTRQGWYTHDQASVTVGDFRKRDSYRISDASSPYAGLEGDYPSIEAIYEKMKMLSLVGSIPGDGPNTWRCPKCSYGGNTANSGCRRPYTEYKDRCTYENQEVDRWSGVGPNAKCGTIDIFSGDTTCFSTCIAKLSILN